MILHFSQIFFTEGFTFTVTYHLSLFCTPGYTTLGGIVDRDLDGDLVSGKNLDVIHSELSRDMSSYYHIVRQLYLEGRVGQRFDYRAFKLDNVILWQNNPSCSFPDA